MNTKMSAQEPQRPRKRQVSNRLESEDWWIAAITQEMKLRYPAETVPDRKPGNFSSR